MRKTYLYHKPSAAGLAKIAKLRKGFSDLEDLIREVTPASREQSTGITYLETAAMWAIKAGVVNDPESVAEAV